jgi:hypothetical protein
MLQMMVIDELAVDVKNELISIVLDITHHCFFLISITNFCGFQAIRLLVIIS